MPNLFRMKLPCSLLLLACLVALALPAAAQPLAKTLLWEISGNGLPAPSYLYGTMHVRRPRAFRFNDSVLPKLQACHTFALELDFDTMMGEILHDYLATNDGVARLLRLMRGDTTDSVDRAFDRPYAARQWVDVADDGSNPANIEARQLEDDGSDRSTFEEMTLSLDDWQEDQLDAIREQLLRTLGRGLVAGSDVDSGDKPTIVDAFLYGTAKNGGKRVVGLERLIEQIVLPDGPDGITLPQPSRRSKHRSKREMSLERVFELYCDADLESINAVSLAVYSAERYRKIFTVRNLNMVDRAIPLMREHPTFIAVGAGHLPGDSGMIALFRQRGFNVEPVVARSTAPLDSIGLPIPRLQWIPFRSEGAFTIEFPERPASYDDNASARYDVPVVPRRAHVWPDLGTGIAYSVLEGRLRDYSTHRDTAAVIEALARASRTDDGRSHTETRIVDGQRVVDLEWNGTGGLWSRSRFVVRGSQVYHLKAAGSGGRASSPDIDRFFGSFRLLPASASIWKPVRLEDEAFTVSIPMAMDGRPDTSRSGGILHGRFAAYDPSLAAVYTVTTHEHSGYTRIVDTAKFVRDAMANIGFVHGDIPPARTDSAGRLRFDCRISDETDGVHPVRVVIFGRRLFVLGCKGDTSHAATFFDSFRPSLTPSESGVDELFTDKSEAIFRAIDTATGTPEAVVVASIGDYPFTAGHRERIYRLLERAYPDDNQYRSVRGELLDVLPRICDSTTVPFLRRLVPQISRYDGLTRRLMNTLVFIDSAGADELLLETMLAFAAEGNSVITVLYLLRDRIGRVRGMFPRIMELLPSQEDREPLFALARTAVDSGMADGAMLAPWRGTIAAHIRDQMGSLATMKRDKRKGLDVSDVEVEIEVRNYRIAEAVATLGYLPDEQGSRKLLERLLAAKDQDPIVELRAAEALMRSGHDVRPQIIERRARDPITRLSLYRFLESQGRLALFPAAFRTQRSMCEGMVAEWVEENRDDELPLEEIRLLAEREIEGKDSSERMLLFAFRMDEDDWRVAMCSGQPVDGGVNTSTAIVVSEYSERDSKTIDEHFADLIEQYRRRTAETPAER